MSDTQRVVKQFLSSLHLAGVSHVAAPIVAEADATLEQPLGQEASSAAAPGVVESEPPLQLVHAAVEDELVARHHRGHGRFDVVSWIQLDFSRLRVGRD